MDPLVMYDMGSLSAAGLLHRDDETDEPHRVVGAGSHAFVQLQK